jgi:hypothetical protein
MKIYLYLSAVLVGLGCLFSCNVDPSSPGGKLGSKNYYGNYTMGATSGTAYVYLSATADTLIDLRYALDGGPSITINQVIIHDNGGSYGLTKTDAIGSLSGAITSNFSTLTYQYITGGNTLGFTGSKIQ